MQCNAVKCSLNLLSSFKSFDSTLKSNCHNPVCIHRPFYIFLREHSAFEFVLAAANEFGWISFGGNGVRKRGAETIFWSFGAGARAALAPMRVLLVSLGPGFRHSDISQLQGRSHQPSDTVGDIIGNLDDFTCINIFQLKHVCPTFVIIK